MEGGTRVSPLETHTPRGQSTASIQCAQLGGGGGGGTCRETRWRAATTESSEQLTEHAQLYVTLSSQTHISFYGRCRQSCPPIHDVQRECTGHMKCCSSCITGHRAHPVSTCCEKRRQHQQDRRRCAAVEATSNEQQKLATTLPLQSVHSAADSSRPRRPERVGQRAHARRVLGCWPRGRRNRHLSTAFRAPPCARLAAQLPLDARSRGGGPRRGCGRAARTTSEHARARLSVRAHQLRQPRAEARERQFKRVRAFSRDREVEPHVPRAHRLVDNNRRHVFQQQQHAAPGEAAAKAACVRGGRVSRRARFRSHINGRDSSCSATHGISTSDSEDVASVAAASARSEASKAVARKVHAHSSGGSRARHATTAQRASSSVGCDSDALRSE